MKKYKNKQNKIHTETIISRDESSLSSDESSISSDESTSIIESSISKNDNFDAISSIYCYIVFCSNTIIKVTNANMNFVCIYMIWIISHYIASHLYVELCVPPTFIGLIVSPFLITTPHCQGLRWVILNGGNTITNMWIVIGACIANTVLILVNNP